MSSLDRRPQPLKDAIASDREQAIQAEDCTPCRVIGSGAFIGLGIYTYISGQAQLRERKAEILKKKPFFGMAARQSGITGIAATLVGMGLYRWFN